MEYIPLSKLYYKDLRQYEETYNSRFNSECAVHLDFLIHDHPAFFLELPDLLKAHIRIQNIDKKVYSVCQVLPPAALKQFRNRCLVEEIVLTNNIEGVYSTRREIGELLEDLENRSRRNRFYGLVQKYVMLTRSPNLPLSSCQDIRQSRLDHYHQYIEHLHEGKDNAELYSYLIQATLFSVDGISKKDLATLLHISETTLVKRLRPLINAGLLIREKPSRKVYYRLDLDALDQRYSALFS